MSTLALLLSIAALYDVPPIMLGPAGTIIVSAVLVVLGLLNGYQWYKSREAATYRGTAIALATERDVYKARAERLQTENGEQKDRIARLEAATDLQALQTALANATAENARCHSETARLISENTAMLVKVADTLERAIALMPIAAALGVDPRKVRPMSGRHEKHTAKG